MNQNRCRSHFHLAALAAALALAGCGAPPFSAPRYSVDPNRPYKVSSGQTIYICPAFDRLDPENRAMIDPKFNPAAYLTGALEAELSAAGLKHERVSFSYAPDFSGIQKALNDGSLKDGKAVVLAAAINHFPNNRILSCDFMLYSSSGTLLFQKRCLCMNFSSDNPNVLRMEQGTNFITGPGRADPGIGTRNSLMAPRMVMQELFADPDFQHALQ
jgi:hypothetical protein